MQMLAFVLLALGLASAAKSGPYLPSGWRPQGPTFDLPGELQRASDNAIKETIQLEAEGSDALKEYGPPKAEISQELTKQELPEISTEQAFVAIDLRAISENEIERDTVVEATEDKEENKTEDKEVEDKIQDVEVNTEVQKEDVQEKTETKASLEVKSVQNIADALANLEKDATIQRIETFENNAELKTVEDSSENLDQSPEGFLEYGPPGFKEYGPPKQETLARSAAVIADVESITEAATEAIAPASLNDARKRRFSPKFRLSRRTH